MTDKKVIVQWTNPTVCATKRAEAEDVYKGRLTELFGSVDAIEKAQIAARDLARGGRRKWSAYNAEAALDAARTIGMTPSELMQACWKVRLE